MMVFVELVSSIPPPTSLYDVADFAEFHLNVSKLFVELESEHGPSMRGAKISHSPNAFQ